MNRQIFERHGPQMPKMQLTQQIESGRMNGTGTGIRGEAGIRSGTDA
ncbi:hypothetical protein ABT383_11920 [Streptomyces humidus]